MQIPDLMVEKLCFLNICNEYLRKLIQTLFEAMTSSLKIARGFKHKINEKQLPTKYLNINKRVSSNHSYILF